jgi:RecG-like helicase
LEVDLGYIHEVEPEFAYKLGKALEFKNSEYGKEVEKEINFLESTSEKETVSYLCEGDVDKAKTSAALAAACQAIRNILWEDALVIARDITARKEGEW